MLCGKGRVRTQDLRYQSGALWPLRYTPGEDKTITSSLDTSVSVIAYQLCSRAHFCTLKDKDGQKLDHLKRSVLDTFEVLWEWALESLSESMGLFGIKRNIFDRILELVAMLPSICSSTAAGLLQACCRPAALELAPFGTYFGTPPSLTVTSNRLT